jgi:hypothetical protein
LEDEFSLVIEWKSEIPAVEEIGAVGKIDLNLKYKLLLTVIAN